ncbi:hypothetical protein SUGI_0519450 [Cryptomeria japonica]|nr:hypothetical protein SUGI_0519450 [Cryptomeria japonica]
MVSMHGMDEDNFGLPISAVNWVSNEETVGQINLVDPDEIMKMVDSDTTSAWTMTTPGDDVAKNNMTNKGDKEKCGVVSFHNQTEHKVAQEDESGVPQGYPTLE